MCFFRKKFPSKYNDEVSRLTDLLETVGKKEGFLSERPGGLFDKNCRSVQAREIGERFFEIGGVPLMEDRVKKISKKLGKELGAHLEASWRDVGGIF
jgi:hypothetical protein